MERNSSTVPDVTFPKDFPELKLMDDALRCSICYEYLKTSMVTPCAHSYCSICIRRSLHYKQACPTCFEETFETSLRNDRALDRLVELFVSIRDKLIKHLRIAAIHFTCNEQKSPALPQNSTAQQISVASETPKRDNQKATIKSSTKGKLNVTSTTPSTSSANKSLISKKLEDILGSPSNNISSNESDCPKIPTVPSMFLQPVAEVPVKPASVATVPCPVCSVCIPERNINSHLDNCLSNASKPVKSPTNSKPKRNPLPKMVWSLMVEKDLRKKLKEYGLNSQGDKKALINRIQRYILLYNSECDSDNPRPVSDIIRQVQKEEQTTPSANQQRLLINKKTDPKIIEEENKKYRQENKDSFKKLIEAMQDREGRNIRPVVKSSNIIISDDDDDIAVIESSKCGPTSPTANGFISPSYKPTSPSYGPASPLWGHITSPASPGNGSNSPSHYNPTCVMACYGSPEAKGLLSPSYKPTSPCYGPTSPNGSISPSYYKPTSPRYGPTSPNRSISPSYYKSTSPHRASNSPSCKPPSPNYGPTSPILSTSRNTSNQLNDFNSESSDSDNFLISSKNKIKIRLKEVKNCDGLNRSVRLESPTSRSEDNVSPSLLNSADVSLSRSPSPSCIARDENSDSEDIINTLINKHIDADDEIRNEGTESEHLPNIDSQIQDPDFVVDTEEIQNDNGSEEVFIPHRKLKRKRQNAVADNNKTSPRRSRRRLTKK